MEYSYAFRNRGSWASGSNGTESSIQTGNGARLETGPDWKRELSGRGRKTAFDPQLPFEGEDKFGRWATTRVQSGDGPTISQP
jgi:hypothetical protein